MYNNLWATRNFNSTAGTHNRPQYIRPQHRNLVENTVESKFATTKALNYKCIDTFGEDDCYARKKAGECDSFPL